MPKSSTAISLPPAHIGETALAELSKLLQQAEFAEVTKFILADENTMEHCLPRLMVELSELHDAEVIEIESGEENKDLDSCVQLWQVLTELGARRNSLFINLGGGVICDLGGFVAASFKRGMPFIHIPTTLLAQVDAAIGGKVGVNLGTLKNQIGQFAEPVATIVDPEFLKTLETKHLKAGFAEMIKHALITDRELWKQFLAIDLITVDAVSPFVDGAIRIKQAIVEQDEREAGLRKVLNFGHTAGHAIESASMEEELHLLHGEAVAAGMCIEAKISVSRGLQQQSCDEICKAIHHWFGKLQWVQPQKDKLLQKMMHDKKNRGQELNFTLLESIGKAKFDIDVESEQVSEAIDYYHNFRG